MRDIKEHDWFRQDYTPLGPNEEDDEDYACTEDEVASVHETVRYYPLLLTLLFEVF